MTPAPAEPCPSGEGPSGTPSTDWELGLALATASQVWRARLAGALAESGYGDLRPSDLQLLRLVDGGVASVGELAGLFEVSKQAVSKVVDSLAARGYLDRAIDEADRRRVRLVITPRAGGAILAARQLRERDTRRLVGVLGEDGLRGLREGLAAVLGLRPDHKQTVALARRLADEDRAEA
ncbi:MarR family winged helix-turn-helix transcriptional regulator [Pseudofrankia inefficax]|uniref:Regulatory protein MarR n=1 Tax=Pseudofrankia inefficax (strain DSM 45817 / CECT 9037 / DDB 130130 / EuI1c) TaxID=298654 RepID=E3J9U4_PSEI1|nr:MarR family transcriptional regulator [Pseudofrankia inefficax]ADP84597.1 regulatory protein MarR [Pseudofrankia inefficax]